MKSPCIILILSFIWFSCQNTSESKNITGCTDINACNYIEESNIDDNSCIYQQDNYDCEGVCLTLDECGNCIGETIDYVQLFNDCYNIGTTISLDLSNRQINYVPEEISELENLEYLNLGFNQITVIPESIGNLVNLKKLILTANELNSIPNNIGNLINLDTLHLMFNSIDSLPETIGNLTDLILIDLDWNELTVLPEEIVNISGLKTLNLGNNQLTELPDSIGNFINLEKLFFDNNDIKTLPSSICDIPVDCYVIATGNQLCDKFKFSCINWGWNDLQWGQQDCVDF